MKKHQRGNLMKNVDMFNKETKLMENSIYENLVSVKDGYLFTDSEIIARGTNNEHRAVLQLIRKNIEDFQEFGGVAFQMRPFKTAGGIQNKEVCILNEHQATLLITFMRNSEIVKKFKKQLVKAFFEMAKNKSKPKEMTRMEILAMAMEAEKEKERLALEIKENAPKVEFHEAVTKTNDSLSLAEAAKILGTGRNKFAAFLREIGWIMKSNEPYQNRVNQGHMDVKIQEFNHPDYGLRRSVTPLVTGKGIALLYKKFISEIAN